MVTIVVACTSVQTTVARIQHLQMIVTVGAQDDCQVQVQALESREVLQDAMALKQANQKST